MRSSMWSTMPMPWRQPISAARSSRSTIPRRSPFERHRHAALEADGDDLGLVGRQLGPGHELEDVVVGRVVELLDPAPSDERPQRLSSIEYGVCSAPPLIGMPCSRA